MLETSEKEGYNHAQPYSLQIQHTQKMPRVQRNFSKNRKLFVFLTLTIFFYPDHNCNKPKEKRLVRRDEDEDDSSADELPPSFKSGNH